ncbi:MAG: hypothetical protein ACOY5B_02260 [Spirochaetota bacterium]
MAVLLTVVLVFPRATCRGEGPRRVDGPTAQELGKAEREQFATTSTRNYPAYRSLRVDFTLKGKVDNQELYYEGELQATPSNLKIRLTDAVFLSPLLTLDIGETKVALKDHARNKTESIARADYQWVELFGRSFPVRFFEPLMRGYLPPDATASDTILQKTAGGDTLARVNNNAFEAALYFNEAKLRKIYYRDKLRGEILVFEMKTFFKNRTYPQKMRIEHSRSNDYLQLDFRGLRIN